MHLETNTEEEDKFFYPACFTPMQEDGTCCLWSIEPIGDDALDLQRGAMCADEVIRFAQDCKAPAVIVMTLREILFNGRWTALEAGFVSRIGMASYTGSFN